LDIGRNHLVPESGVLLKVRDGLALPRGLHVFLAAFLNLELLDQVSLVFALHALAPHLVKVLNSHVFSTYLSLNSCFIIGSCRLTVLPGAHLAFGYLLFALLSLAFILTLIRCGLDSIHIFPEFICLLLQIEVVDGFISLCFLIQSILQLFGAIQVAEEVIFDPLLISSLFLFQDVIDSRVVVIHYSFSEL